MAKTVKSNLYEDLKRQILTMELDPDADPRSGRCTVEDFLAMGEPGSLLFELELLRGDLRPQGCDQFGIVGDRVLAGQAI